MNRFLRDNIVSNYNFPTEFKEVFQPVTNSPEVGSLLDTVTVSTSDSSTCEFDLPKKCSRCTLSTDEQRYILQLFHKLNPQLSHVSVRVNSVFLKYGSIDLNRKKFVSSGKKKNPSVAILRWDENLYDRASS